MQSRLQLFRSRSGELSAKAVFDDKSFRHLHSLVEPEAEANLYDGLEWFGGLVVFAGIGLGYHVARLLGSLPDRTRCVVIDYYPECVTRAREVLFAGKSNPVFFVSAQDLAAKRDELIRFVNNSPAEAVQIVRHPASYDINRDFYDPVLDEIHGRFLAARPALASAVKRVLLCHGDFFLEEELRRALATAGCKPIAFRYKEHHGGMHFEAGFLRAVQEHRPACILSVNMKGFDGEGMLGRIASRFSIPVAVWFVDDPRPILLSHKKRIPANAVAFCWERTYLPLLREEGFSRAEYLPLAGDPVMFSGRPPDVATTRLGFVGTAMVDRLAGNIREKFLWSDSLSPLVDVLSRRLLAEPALDVFASIDPVSKHLRIPLPFSDERNTTWLCAYITHFASMLKRKSAVNALLSQGIETFGDPEGWRELLGSALATHPNIDYRHDLAAAYRAIAVNVNITSCQMPSAVNQRVFDIPLTSSFVLSDRQADLAELFDSDEVATYGSIEELAEKAAFYAEHQTDRKRIVEKAAVRIREEHTYEHRVKVILAALT